MHPNWIQTTLTTFWRPLAGLGRASLCFVVGLWTMLSCAQPLSPDEETVPVGHAVIKNPVNRYNMVAQVKNQIVKRNHRFSETPDGVKAQGFAAYNDGRSIFKLQLFDDLEVRQTLTKAEIHKDGLVLEILEKILTSMATHKLPGLSLEGFLRKFG